MFSPTVHMWYLKRDVVKIDENLNWDSHIEKICKKASAANGAMKRIKPFAPTHTLQCSYKRLVQPYFDFFSLWDTSGRLLRFQYRGAKF